MNKFILAILVTLMTVFGVNASIDTVKVKPGEKLLFELKVDTDKYPVLKGNENKVTWKHGDVSLAGSSDIKVLDGVTYFNSSAVDSNYSGYYWYEFELSVGGVVSIKNDTIKYIHVYDKPEITKFTFQNGDTDITLNEGDTAKIHIEVQNELNAEQYILLNGNNIILSTTCSDFWFIPSKEGIESYVVKVLNPYSNSITTKPRHITMIPNLKFESLEYFAQTGKNSIVKNSPSPDMIVSVLNHDSVELTVNTNSENVLSVKDDSNITYSWNKEGFDLPSGIKVKDNKLVIADYSTKTMDGKYNCVISNETNTFVITFNVMSTYPTSNEYLSRENISVTSSNNNVIISNAYQKRVTVTTLSGAIVFDKVSTSDLETVRVSSGLALVTVDGKTYKVLVR